MSERIIKNKDIHDRKEQNKFILKEKKVNDIFLLYTEKEVELAFPLGTQKKLINAIKINNVEEVRQVIGELFEGYFKKTGYVVENIQQIVMIMSSSVLGNFYQENTYPEMIKINIYSWIYEAIDLKELKEAMIGYFEKIINIKTKQDEKECENEYISKAISFIKKNFNKDIYVNDIADYIRLNVSYLSRIFKKATGKTFVEYMTIYRLEISKRMLKESKKHVKDIGIAVGYTEVRSFVRFFKKYEGITPSEYREKKVINETVNINESK